MKTEDQLIAEFDDMMLWKTPNNPTYKPYWARYTDESHVTFIQVKIENFKYSKSFDWLMPVVKKIESVERTLIIIYGDATKIWVDDFEGIELFATTQHGNKDNKIDHVRRACLEYIKWYNSQPK